MLNSNCLIEPNTLTRADHVRRAFTTKCGNLMPGITIAEYMARYADAAQRDRELGTDPQLRSASQLVCA